MVSWLELSTPGHRAPMLRSERAPLFHPDVSPQVRPTPRTLFHISLLTQSSGLALVLSDVNICTVWTDVKYCRKNNKWIQFEDPPDVWETSGRSGDSLVELLFYKNINTGRWQFSMKCMNRWHHFPSSRISEPNISNKFYAEVTENIHSMFNGNTSGWIEQAATHVFVFILICHHCNSSYKLINWTKYNVKKQ